MTNPPQRIFIEITTECNLRCKLCHLWKCIDPVNRLTLNEKSIFLREVLEWQKEQNHNNTSLSKVILTGGEPFLFPDQVFLLSKLCKNYYVDCYVNSNGSLLKPFTREVMDSGLKALTLSIDSHKAGIHDDLRGAPGLFDVLINEIKKFEQMKADFNTTPKLCVQSILGNWNLPEIEEHIRFFESLGLDGIEFQPIQYPFGVLIPSRWYKTFDQFPKSRELIEVDVNFLLEHKESSSFIMNSKEEIKLWGEYFQNPEYLNSYKQPCKAYEQNLIVDVSGNVKFCFNMMLDPPNRIGNIRNNAFNEIWNNNDADKVRDIMKNCHRSCGIMACHIDSNLRIN